MRLRDVDRFWSKVDRRGPDDCWEWAGARLHARGDYGQFSLNSKVQYAHRVAWEIKNGPILEGALVCHSCDNPPCVNSNHLFLSSYKGNAQDAAIKGRIGKWDRRGTRNPAAKLTIDQVREIKHRQSEGEGDTKLGREFGVTKQAIYWIRTGKNWSHVV